MNVIEAAKAAGWTQTAIDMASKQEIERIERFAQIIRNQALEDAAVCCDELQTVPATEARHCAQDIRAMKKAHQ